MEVYAGAYYTQGVEELQLKLVDGYRKFADMSGRNITCDNLYTPLPLGKELLYRKITMVGTLRHNRKGIPKKIKSIDRRDI